MQIELFYTPRPVPAGHAGCWRNSGSPTGCGPSICSAVSATRRTRSAVSPAFASMAKP